MIRRFTGRHRSAGAELRPRPAALTAVLWLALGSSVAQAFCGTYVGGSGDELTNHASEVAIVRQGSRTVLSVSNDVHGDTEDFALVIPVPEVVQQEGVHVLDHGLFDRLDQYSQPRLVRYDCSDFGDADTDADTDSDSDVDTDTDTDVEVEAEYVVGEYQIVVLSADQSAALFEWLNGNGYVVPDTSVDLLQDYIDGGSYFLAARVAPEAQIASGERLSPLQIAYDSAAFALPVRIGTLNADGAQDLIVYAVNPWSEGAVAVANYPQAFVEDECMWDSAGETFGEYYTSAFERVHARADSAIWVQEYAWGGAGCDPCSGTPPDAQDLATLGYGDGYDFFFTRLHLRYTPEQVPQDLAFYNSRIKTNEQQRYIEYMPLLEDTFPICGEGFADEPRSCWDDPSDPGEDGGVRPDGGFLLRGRGCAAVPQAGGASLLLLAGVLAAARIRRDAAGPRGR